MQMLNNQPALRGLFTGGCCRLYSAKRSPTGERNLTNQGKLMFVDECAMTGAEYAKCRAEQIEHEEKEAQTEKQLCEVRKAIGQGDWSGLVWDTHDAKKVPVNDLFSRFLSEEKEGQEDTGKAIIRALAGHPDGLWQLTREFFGWYEKECMA